MMLKCSSCGIMREGNDICFCANVTNANGDPCGSLMMPYEGEEKPEAIKPRKEGK